jgi:hypothetical protein
VNEKTAGAIPVRKIHIVHATPPYPDNARETTKYAKHTKTDRPSCILKVDAKAHCAPNYTQFFNRKPSFRIFFRVFSVFRGD